MSEFPPLLRLNNILIDDGIFIFIALNTFPSGRGAALQTITSSSNINWLSDKHGKKQPRKESKYSPAYQGTVINSISFGEIKNKQTYCSPQKTSKTKGTLYYGCGLFWQRFIGFFFFQSQDFLWYQQFTVRLWAFQCSGTYYRESNPKLPYTRFSWKSTTAHQCPSNDNADQTQHSKL